MRSFRSFDVVTTVRSEEKGDKILAAHPNTPKEKLSYVIVKDIAQDGAFDEVGFYLQFYPGLPVCGSIRSFGYVSCRMGG